MSGWSAERWNSSRDAMEMLHFNWPRLTSDRKFWLFAAGCWRSVWPLIGPETRRDVERLELFADSPEELWTQDELNDIADSLTPPREFSTEQAGNAPWDIDRARREASGILAHFVLSPAEQSILFEGFYGELGSATRAGPAVRAAWEEQSAICADLLRDVIGNPFLPPPTIAPDWLVWNSSIIVRIAQAIADKHDFGRLPVLGDALEEAGCSDGEVLAHCRAGRRHTRGCWLVDLVFGRHVLVERPARNGRETSP
jgi:hypothetical protein